MVAITSGILLLILEYNSVYVKWKVKLFFAAINIREFLSSKSSNFMIPITCSIIKAHVRHCCKNRAAVLLNILIFCATVGRTVVDFKLCSRGSESRPRSCRAGWIFPFKACSHPQMTLCSTGWQQQVGECLVMPQGRITKRTVSSFAARDSNAVALGNPNLQGFPP